MFFAFSVINQEKTVQGIEKFNRDSLKHAETQEKQALPTKEGMYHYNMLPGVIKGVGLLKYLNLSSTHKAPITTAADNIHKYFFIVFSEKIRCDFSSESSARQRIHMKNQALFSSKDKSKTQNVVCCNVCLAL